MSDFDSDQIGEDVGLSINESGSRLLSGVEIIRYDPANSEEEVHAQMKQWADAHPQYTSDPSFCPIFTPHPITARLYDVEGERTLLRLDMNVLLTDAQGLVTLSEVYMLGAALEDRFDRLLVSVGLPDTFEEDEEL